jgi:hypothetical protein
MGIYPDWFTLLKKIRAPGEEKRKRFAKQQETCRNM